MNLDKIKENKLLFFGLVGLALFGIAFLTLHSGNTQSNCYTWYVYKVCKIKGGYELILGNEVIAQAYYPPDQVLNLGNVTITYENLSNKKVYVLFLPEAKGNYSAVVLDFLMFKLPQFLAYANNTLENLEKACLKENELCKEYGFKYIKPECNDSNSYYLIFKLENKTYAYQIGHCIYIEGSYSTLPKSYSYLIYKLLGII